jgi:lysophospholipase L1-like esterase
VNPLLLPVVAAEALWVRLVTRGAPPAAGPTTGTVGDASGPLVRIGVLGESPAAGCGVDTHDNGFPGSFARELVARTGRPVQWEVVGQDAATARRIRYRLLPQLGDDLTLAVLIAGTNDVLSRRAPEQWGDDLAAIVDDLTERAEHVVVTGVPPFEAFPSLPTTLGRYLAQRGAAIDEASQQICAERPRATWISSADFPPEGSDFPPAGPNYFAEDRFHLSAFGYRHWARYVAGHLALGEL